MRSALLHSFLEKIMTLNAGFSGMGGAQAGLIGSRSTETDVITEVRRNALAFAAEYQNAQADRANLKSLAQKLEGSLRSLHALSAISEATLLKLLKDLSTLAGPNL